MKLLLIVHVEDSFRRFFPKMYIQRLIKECKKDYYVVHLTSGIDDYEPIDEIKFLVNKTIDWGYGYEPDSFDDDEKPFVIESSGHEYTWVPTDFRNGFLNRFNEVYLVGGHDGECLADMESVLDHINVDYKKILHLVY